MSGLRLKVKRLLEHVPPFTDTNGPGIAPEDKIPLGDTSQVHDEISPLDIPLDNPGRHEAERQASRSGGLTRGGNVE